MKLFDVDWERVLRELPRWFALPHAARHRLLEALEPHGYISAERFGSELPAITASGMALHDANRGRVWAAPDHRELLKVLRAMNRHRVFDAPDHEALMRYLADHFTSEDIDRLGRQFQGGYGFVSRQTLAPRLAFSGWVADLLDARGQEGLAAWGDERGWRAATTKHPGDTLRSLERLQTLARELAPHTHGMPLRGLLAERDGRDRAAFADALYAGLATGVVYAGLRGRDLEPLVGLWPRVAEELARPPATKPGPVVPVEHFTLAIGMEDMTTVLATIAAAPLRVRADDLAVFARARTTIETRLAALPQWAAQLFISDRWTRVDEAARELEVYRFAVIREHDGNPHLTVTPKGKHWLALDAHDRLAALIDPLRASKEENPRGGFDVGRADSFFPFALPFYHIPESLRLRRALTAAFLEAVDDFIPLEGFLDYAAREANPFLELQNSKGRYPSGMEYATVGDPREGARNLWRNSLAQFLVIRLLRLGGASVGRTETGALCFKLTDVGRYLLADTNRFEYGSPGSAEIIVQPNFDVVFLGAAPAIEATLARFAERVGATPGLAFKITRASVLAAAEAGATADDILVALREASSKPIPKNVEKEIAGWVASMRRARVRAIEVIECDDEETAHRVAQLLGAKVRRLTPTLFELTGETRAARAAMLKRLRAAGVFLEEDIRRTSRKATHSRRFTEAPAEEEEEFPMSPLE
jgi:hypothetical protein